MIYKLQRKFILICTVSVLAVVTLIFGIILALNISSMNKNMDILADRVSEGGGKFPSQSGGHKPGGMPPNNDDKNFGFITPETPFATRHFTVLFDSDGNVAMTNTDAIFSITDEVAIEYAKEVIDEKNGRGWLDNYRYKVFQNDLSTGVVFIDGSMNRSSLTQSMTIAGLVLLSSAALVLILIFIFSKRAVCPIAESYEKQKQFVTDANHELKTPLTLILANLDIAEAELGKNEWLDDIRAEGHRMTELVGQLVSLSRMDEDSYALNIENVELGKLVDNTVSEFEPLAKDREKTLLSRVDTGIICRGDEALLSRLVGILMDNAIKYCDTGGDILVTLQKGKRVILTVENTYSAVGELELHRLFDRFYRADKARKFIGGYGVGLSIAKAIAQKHKGEITAYKKDSTHIGFKIVI